MAALAALTGVAEGDIYTVTSLPPFDDSVLYRTTNKFLFTKRNAPGNPSYILKGVGGLWLRIRDAA